MQKHILFLEKMYASWFFFGLILTKTVHSQSWILYSVFSDGEY